jgi:phosphorylcholine metabolism protein LicD
LTALDVMNRDKSSMKLSNVEKYSIGKRITFKILYVLGKIVPRKIKVKLYTTISENMWLGDKTMLHRSNDQYKGRSEDFTKKWMSEYVLLPFEGEKFSCMAKYHDMLVKCYGENYMTPIKDDRNKNVHDIVRSFEDGGIKL